MSLSPNRYLYFSCCRLLAVYTDVWWNLQVCVFTMATSTIKASPGTMAVNMSVLVKMQMLVFTAAHPSEFILRINHQY